MVTIDVGDGQLRTYTLVKEGELHCDFYLIENRTEKTGWCDWLFNLKFNRWEVSMTNDGAGQAAARQHWNSILDDVQVQLIAEKELLG